MKIKDILTIDLSEDITHVIDIDEKFEIKKKELEKELGGPQLTFDTYEKVSEFDLFATNFYDKLGEAVKNYATDETRRFDAQATIEAVTFLKIMVSTRLLIKSLLNLIRREIVIGQILLIAILKKLILAICLYAVMKNCYWVVFGQLLTWNTIL